MEESRKRIRSLIAAAVIAVLALAVGLLSPDQTFAATSGDCGTTPETVFFEIDGDGTMTISGEGSILEQSRYSNYLWYADRTKVKKLVLKEGVTNAPNSAFYGMTNLKDVELPSTLDTWGTNVFQSSSNIETIQVTPGGSFSTENNILFGENNTRLILSGKGVTGEVLLPETLTTIDASGLDGRSGITALTLPEGLLSIGNYAFRGLNQVKTIILPETVTTIGTNVFQNCTSLTEAKLPAGVTALSNYTFGGCSALEMVTLPEGLTSIGTYAFQNCTKLEAIEIPNGVTSIGNNAFSGTSIKTIELPEALTTLGSSVFSECKNLKSIRIPSGVTILGASATSSSLFLNCTALEEVVLPETLVTIGASAFKGCSALESIIIPDSVNTIGGLAFQQCTALKEVTVPANVTSLTGTFAGCTSLKKVVLPEGLTELKQGGSGASMVGPFAGCEALEEIQIPAGVTTIPKDTFNGCKSLTTLGLTEGVTSIGQSAYMGCSSLEDITIPGTVTTVMGGAFENCENLNRVRLGDGMLKFNSDNKSATTAFKNCSRLTEIYIPDSLEGFNPITFEQADSIQRIIVGENGNFTVIDGVLYNKDVTTLVYIPASYAGKLVLPATVENTGSRVAGYTHALTEIVFPEGFKAIGDSAFYYADGVRKVTLPETLESIGASGFRATGLTEIVIPDSVTSIGTNAFTLCEKMKKAVIGNGITTIPSQAFFNCYKLSDLTLPAGLTEIGAQAFSGTQVPEIEIPDGCLKIGATALANNSNLNKVILPASLTSIPSTVFNNDTGLKYIYYKGTADQWAALKCTPAYGTVITDYMGEDHDMNPAVIATQPQSALYQKGQEPEALTITVSPEGVEGEQYFYTWYKNNTGNAEGGTTVEGTAIENGSSCLPTTDKIGTVYYYCVVTRMVNGYTSKRVVSDVAAVTIKMQMDGGGSEQDPFLVKNAEDLKTIYSMVKEGNTLEGVFIKMTDDIVLPEDWDPIGVLKEGATGSGQGKNTDPFSGTFDGDGHQITVPEGGKPLFGYVRNATIKNLNIYGPRIEGTGLVDHYERDYETGSSQSEFGNDAKYIVTIENVTLKAGTKTRESGLVGENNQSQDASSMNPVLVVSCKAEPGVEIGYNHDEDQIGTFVGRVCGTVINCESYADVYGRDRVGGIAGCQDVAMGILHVINCSYHGTVHATGNFAGGILGSGYRGSAPNALCVEIRNCHADGEINGKDYVGGIFGAEDEVAQCWSNGIGYINNNLFTGTLKPGEGAGYVGGIIGYYRSLNKLTNFENNWFREGCGADFWLGGAQFIDTSGDHEMESGITYINTKDTIANCPYVQFCDWKQGLNRTDDPFGKDASKLGASASDEALKNGEVLEKLNEGTSSMRNWILDDNGIPRISTDPVCYQLTLSGDYKTEYVIGDELDKENMILTAAWTDGSVTNPAIDDEQVIIEGFDSESRGVKNVTISYGSAKTQFSVRVLKPSSGEMIRVSLELFGDTCHGADAADIHTMKMGTLETWIPKTVYEVDENATVRDVLEIALGDGYTIQGTDSYISGITPKDGQELAEFTNGINSGWMYLLNGEHSQNMVSEQFLNDGDEIIFHYTDDYTFEEDGLDVEGIKALIAEIQALPAVAEVQVEDAENVWAAADAFAGLAEDMDRLIPSELKEKLNALDETVTPAAAEQYQQEAAQAVADAEAAVAKAQESSKKAEKAQSSGSSDALKLVQAAQKDAEAATQKAEAAEAAAQKAQKALERVQAQAEKAGDEERIQAAKEAVEAAKKSVTAAQSAKASAQKMKTDADAAVAEIEKKAGEDSKAAAAKIKAAQKLTVKKLKVKAKKGKKVQVKWKKTKGAQGYQIQYRQKGKKWTTLDKPAKTTKVTVKKLKKGKKYSFRVRTVVTVNGKPYYGKWTKIKNVKVKK